MSDPRLDDLRQQLRSLGYLDAGVDRFLLAPARGTRGPLALAARSSVRVGLLGAVLLGPAAAIGLGARLPGLISSLQDALVLALYLGILFLVAVAATAFIVSAAATMLVRARGDRFTRRARRVSEAAGWLITAGCLAYLTFWWRNANAGFGWSAPVWTAFALAVAVGISLLLGHAVRITTLAVLGAGGGSAPLPRIPSPSWRVVIGGGALAFAGAAVLLVLTSPTPDAERTPGRLPLTVVSTAGERVRLIAIDGFDSEIYAQLRDSLPALKFVLGGRQLTLQPQDTSDPARAWTTIATGVTPEAHGVHAIETRRVAGVRGVIPPANGVSRLIGTATDIVRLTRPSVASRDERKAKTIWEVAEEAGLRTAVVNWWATWPAPATGIVVTDRAVLRLERGGPLDGEVGPAGLYDSLRTQWPQIRRRAQDAASEAFPDQTETAGILRRSAELDAAITGMARALPSLSLDLVVVYLPGLDIAQNALLGATAGTLAPSAVAARVEALRSYYPFLDRVLGPLVEPAEKQALMVVTQPGRVQTSTGGLFAVAPQTRDSVMGDVAMVNEPLRVDNPGGSMPVDVAPTIWWRLGLPLSRELAGKPATDLFGGPASVDRFVPTYGRPFVETAPRSGKPLDQEMIDRLRSLGYVK